MILDAFDAQPAGAFNAPKIIKNGQELEELSPKNLGVSIKLFNTVYKVLTVTQMPKLMTR